MNTLFINSKNSKYSHILVLKLANELDLRIGEKTITLSNLRIYYTWKNIKNSYNNNKLKISAPTWNDKFNYQMDRILYQILKIILNIFLKNLEKILMNHQYKNR